MWLDELENPEAINSVFETAPSLDEVEIVSVSMDRDGPTVVLAVALHESPSKPSPRWQRTGANAVTLNLQMFAVEAVKMEGWSTDNKVKLTIVRESPDQMKVTAVGPRVQMSWYCRFIRVHGLTPYRRESASIPTVG